MKSLRIHGPLDLRIEDYQVDNLGANQVEIHIAIGGICGTDLHYYKHGGFGKIKLREPKVFLKILEASLAHSLFLDLFQKLAQM